MWRAILDFFVVYGPLWTLGRPAIRSIINLGSYCLSVESIEVVCHILSRSKWFCVYFATCFFINDFWLDETFFIIVDVLYENYNGSRNSSIMLLSNPHVITT